MIIIYLVCASESEATKISRELVKDRLAACTNHWKIKSCYSWKSKMQESQEVAMIVKTTKEKEKQVYDKIKQIHSYDTPAIFTIHVDRADSTYLEWVRGVK